MVCRPGQRRMRGLRGRDAAGRSAVKGPRISDHALLRFLERGGGLAVEELRAQLELSIARAGEAAERLGACDNLIRADKFVFVVRGRVVTTILPEGSCGDRFRMVGDH